MSRKSPKRNTRQLRDRKERKFYTDDILGDADDEIEGPQSFDLEEKLTTTRYANKAFLVKELKGTEFDFAYIQQNGFTTPLLFKDKTGLGIRVPGPNFSVSDVKTCVGSKRMLDVMDVRTQKNLEMTMKQWQEYYDNPAKDRLLNVISLEFSHTKLENYVESPTVVRQLDWVDRVWPNHLKNMQTESTNVIDEMMYPKVQKYCLMSVKGCYTDFHVDFGGTSVWYHILKGAKVFWLIPPTEKNLDLYQAWVLSGKQGDTFFGDNVEDCGRVYLQSGDTFFIPSGWIHAVYTPKDSLVFGGNFLHSFGIDKQLRIAGVEEATKVPQKFRYPFFTEMLWYTLARYVHCLLGRNFICIPNDENGPHLEPSTDHQVKDKLVPDGVHISPQEYLGLKAIVLYLHQLPLQRKNVPAIISTPGDLLTYVRQIILEHKFDNPDKAVTGRPILVWPGEKAEDVGRIRATPEKKKPVKSNNNVSVVPVAEKTTSVQELKETKVRRVKCEVCQSCLINEDCNECFKCLTSPDSVCIMRECMKPLLPVTTVCCECALDGWNEIPGASAFSLKRNGPSSLLECSICTLVTHALCIGTKASESVLGIVNDDLPNSWECPICIERSMKQPRGVKRAKSGSIEQNRECTGNVYSVIVPMTNGKPSVSAPSSIGNYNAGLKTPTAQPAQSNRPGTPSPAKAAASKSPAGGRRKSADSKTNKDPLPNGDSASDKVKPIREDEKHVQQKLTQVQQKLLQGRKSVDEPSTGKKVPVKKSGSKGEGKTPQQAGKRPSLTPKPAGKRPVTPAKRSLSPQSKLPAKPPLKRRASDDPTKASKRRASKEGEEDEDDGPPLLKPMIDMYIPPPPPLIKKPKILEIKTEPMEVEDDEPEHEEAKRASPIKFPQRTHLSSRIITRSAKSLKQASNVVRPAPISEFVSELPPRTTPLNKKINYWKEKEVMVQIFRRLSHPLLTKALLVCKDWNQIGLTSIFWRVMDLTHQTITENLLQGLVRRQPRVLILDWTQISKIQLAWIISRSPQLRELSLKGVPWKTLEALKSSSCPALTSLDLGFVSGLTDSALREILAPPVDSRPGLTDSQSRLRQLKKLHLAGANISDVALRYITQHAGSISTLDISTCSKITDAGIAQLGAPDSPSIVNLTSLNLSGCPQLTNISLDHVRRLRNLENLDIRNIPQITLSGLTKYHHYFYPRPRNNVKSDFYARGSGLPAGGSDSSKTTNVFQGPSCSGGPSSSGSSGFGKQFINPKSMYKP